MKTYRSTLTRYLLASLLIAAGSIALLNTNSFDLYRDALSNTLGLPAQYVWVLGSILSLAAIVLLSQRLHAKLSNPISTLADQCANDSLTDHLHEPQTREIRIIREYLRQNQLRADTRADQIQRMEAELAATRKERDRSFRKLEELEDLVASYGRIRSELQHDNKLLRHQNTKTQAELRSHQIALQQSSSPNALAEINSHLQSLRQLAAELNVTADQLAQDWERHSFATIRDSLQSIAQKSELQAAQIDTLAESLSLANERPTPPRLNPSAMSEHPSSPRVAIEDRAAPSDEQHSNYHAQRAVHASQR